MSQLKEKTVHRAILQYQRLIGKTLWVSIGWKSNADGPNSNS